MKKLLKRTGAALTALCLLTVLSGCGGETAAENSEIPVLTVQVPMELEKTATVRTLSDPRFVRRVEEELGCRLDLRMLPAGMDYNEVALLDVPGILLTDDPAWVVPLVESRKILSIDAQTPEQSYGQYNNSTYGYVLEDPSWCPRTAVVLANLEALRSLGSSWTEFDPEAVYEILTQLKGHYRIPLAVSGMPTDAGFAPLLALFDIAPSGGREMYLDGETVVYDKLSEDAGAYLDYISRLYSEGLIPADALELTEYSCAKLIAQNAAAMAVFTDEVCISQAIAYARENGRELVTVPLPVPEAQLQTGIFSRIVGYAGKGGLSPEEAVAFFGLLQQALRDTAPLRESEDLSKIGQYRLFSDQALRPLREDPREVSTMYVYWLYQKENLDATYLDGAYCKLLFGEAGQGELETAVRAWQEDSNLLGLIGGRYWAHIRGRDQ